MLECAELIRKEYLDTAQFWRKEAKKYQVKYYEQAYHEYLDMYFNVNEKLERVYNNEY